MQNAIGSDVNICLDESCTIYIDFSLHHMFKYPVNLLSSSASLVNTNALKYLFHITYDILLLLQTRGQSVSAKVALNDPAQWSRETNRQAYWQTDTGFIGNNSRHLMHSMQPKMFVIIGSTCCPNIHLTLIHDLETRPAFDIKKRFHTQTRGQSNLAKAVSNAPHTARVGLCSHS